MSQERLGQLCQKASDFNRFTEVSLPFPTIFW